MNTSKLKDVIIIADEDDEWGEIINIDTKNNKIIYFYYNYTTHEIVLYDIGRNSSKLFYELINEMFEYSYFSPILFLSDERFIFVAGKDYIFNDSYDSYLWYFDDDNKESMVVFTERHFYNIFFASDLDTFLFKDSDGTYIIKNLHGKGFWKDSDGDKVSDLIDYYPHDPDKIRKKTEDVTTYVMKDEFRSFYVVFNIFIAVLILIIPAFIIFFALRHFERIYLNRLPEEKGKKKKSKAKSDVHIKCPRCDTVQLVPSRERPHEFPCEKCEQRLVIKES